ncbi:hypothetical protein ZIOFF_070956 [Zingiber officinale]|uniref:Uncharacterized protein n=1 Tax=Zingiber officinale TaxID=94328 RepID=A0A8J5CUF7_ZINOF|nr:hypothetical protein ZIOFF_070956 [Zingiber officinale]
MKPIVSCAARLVAAACSPRRARSRVVPLAAVALPSGLVDDVLMLAEAASSLRSEGSGGLRDEHLCFVSSGSSLPLGHSDVSSSVFFHTQPSRPVQ